MEPRAGSEQKVRSPNVPGGAELKLQSSTGQSGAGNLLSGVGDGTRKKCSIPLLLAACAQTPHVRGFSPLALMNAQILLVSEFQQHPPVSFAGFPRRLCSISDAYLVACSCEQKCFPNRTKSCPLPTVMPHTSQYFVNNPNLTVTSSCLSI
jgi:hypothetical protein